MNQINGFLRQRVEEGSTVEDASKALVQLAQLATQRTLQAKNAQPAANG